MAMPGMGMMAGMLPPGVQQLLDSLPEPDELEAAAARLLNPGEVRGDELSSHPETATFLSLLAQVMKQHGLVEESKEQTEAIRLECPTCHKDFAVANAYQYRRRIEEGFLYACANDHSVTPIGSGRLGSLSPDEQLTSENEPNIVVIFPEGYSNASHDDTGN